MFIERVKLGNGVAIELRGTTTERCTLYGLIVYALDQKMGQELPAPPANVRLRGTQLDEYQDRCFAIIDQFIDTKQRWLMLCTEIDFLMGDHVAEFNRVAQETFGDSGGLKEEPTDEYTKQRHQVIRESDFQVCQRCWFVDRETRRVFYAPFHFAEPIYRTSLFAGVMLRHNAFQPEAEDITAEPEPKQQSREKPATLLSRLRQMMENHERFTDCTESTREMRTEFMIGHVASWCGDFVTAASSSAGLWIAQQLNVWFNSSYYERSDQDICTFQVRLLESIHSFESIDDDYRALLPLDAPSDQNTMARYPRGGPEYCCTLPTPMSFEFNPLATAGGHLQLCTQKTIGIGHFLPVLDDQFREWITTHKLVDVRLFRVYRTQYPFIYTLMPNDDERVKEIKAMLKRSTESNPSISDVKKSTDGSGVPSSRKLTPKYTPLVATLPTLECERFVRAVFRQKPKFQYRLFYCARYDNSEEPVTTIWVPVYPN